MLRRDWRLCLLFLSAVLLLQGSIPGAAQKWLTFDGREPLIVADGGHNMIYPHSSLPAFLDATIRGLPTTILLCDARLTKDNIGICLPDINLKTCTTIDLEYKSPLNNYTINGVLTTGLFTIDYTYVETFDFNLTQTQSQTRNSRFNGDFIIPTVGDIKDAISSPRIWLNIQHDKFYTDHKLNMTKYLLNITRSSIVIEYVSSPEAAFLRNAARLVNTSTTKIIFRFLEKSQQDPSTGQTYGSLLNNLTSIKTFASGIIVPKSYIWPVSESLLLPSEAISSVVLDAHKAGLKVFVSGFANSILFAHNYSYDPFKEYLSYVDNGVFSVDGFLTDASVTASGAIGCLAHTNDSAPSSGKPIIISHGGSSGIFPSCTNLAYEQAIEDKADYIDCPVQVTKDGLLVCLIDIDLLTGTTIAQSDFATATSIIPAIKSSPGIYTFNLTWAEIQTNAKPQIIDRFPRLNRTRHPENKNSGAFITLVDFLDLARTKPPRSGILIGIEYAPFLIGTLGVDVIGDVLKTLSSSNLTQSVIIQSTDSSVLKKIRSQAPSSYQLMYRIDEIAHDIEAAAVKEIAAFASLVAVNKESLYIKRSNFLMNWTQVARKLKAENLTVVAYNVYNDVIDVWWDAYGDPIAEINAYVFGAGVDGIFSEFPATAAAFKRSRCTGTDNKVAPYWVPVSGNQLGVKLDRLDEVAPAAPPVGRNDVAEPPLPALPVSPPAMPPTPAEAAPGAVVCVLLVAAAVSLLLL